MRAVLGGLLLLVTMAHGAAAADKPLLDPLFSDHAVFQRDVRFPIWGWSVPGARVHVEMDGQRARALAGDDGRWLCRLGPFPAGGPHTLTVKCGPQKVTVGDLMAGDVWVCSGEPMELTPGAIPADSNPGLRLFLDTPDNHWQQCTARMVGPDGLSSVGYCFGLEIQQRLRVPIGLIDFPLVILPRSLAVKGVIWEQGGSDAYGACTGLFVIAYWREHGGQKDLPVYVVGSMREGWDSRGPEQRVEGAYLTSIEPHTALDFTFDHDDSQTVGHRLALHALALSYGQKVEYSGPVYESMQIERDAIRLTFDHVAGGMAARGGGRLLGFALAGADQQWVPAEAVIDGPTVVVASPLVRQPVSVRYAWADAPVGNLINTAGLPAVPFRSDSPLERPEPPQPRQPAEALTIR